MIKMNGKPELSHSMFSTVFWETLADSNPGFACDVSRQRGATLLRRLR